MLKGSPYIDKIQLLDESLPDTVRRLKTEHYDFVIDLQNNVRSLRVKRGVKAKSYSLNKLNIRKFLLTFLKFHGIPLAHVADRNLQTLRAFNIRDDRKGLDYFIPEEDEFPQDGLPEDFRNGYVAVVLAGTYGTKRMPVEKLKSVILQTSFQFVLLGGQSEREAGRQILAWNTGNVLDFTGKLRINQSASLIKNARLVISNDTGLMHIAAAFHKKILSVWGNTSPELGMYPYLPGAGSEMLEVKGLPCRPCSKLGYAKCPRKHFRCMNDLPEGRIVEWVEREF